MAARKDNLKSPKHKVVARNRRARFHYHLEETVEAGIALLGTEVKSLRHTGASLEQAYCRCDGSEVWLLAANISTYKAGSWTNHEPTRRRKLLLHKRQIVKIEQQLKIRGRTLIPVEMYFDEKGRVKVLVALATGKKQHDKRQALSDRDSKREIARALKDR